MGDRGFIVAPAVLAAALLAACSRAPGAGLGIGAAARPIRVAAWVKGGTPEAVADFSRYKGKVVLLERWATWCSPCIHEIPALIDLQRKHPGDLAVVSLSAQPKATIAAFLEATTLEEMEKGRPQTPLSEAINYEVASVEEDEPTFDAYFGRLRGVPSFYIIGRDGRIENAVVGAYDVVLSEVARLVEGRSRSRSETTAAERMLELEHDLAKKAVDPGALRERLARLDEQARLRPELSEENAWKKLDALNELWRVSEEGAKPGVAAEVAAQRESLFQALASTVTYATSWVNLSWDASMGGERPLLDAAFARRCAERGLKTLEDGSNKVVMDMAQDALARALFLAGDAAGAAEAERKAVAVALPFRRPRFQEARELFLALARDPKADGDALIGRYRASGVTSAAIAVYRRGRPAPRP